MDFPMGIIESTSLGVTGFYFMHLGTVLFGVYLFIVVMSPWFTAFNIIRYSCLQDLVFLKA